MWLIWPERLSVFSRVWREVLSNCPRCTFHTNTSFTARSYTDLSWASLQPSDFCIESIMAENHATEYELQDSPGKDLPKDLDIQDQTLRHSLDVAEYEEQPTNYDPKYVPNIILEDTILVLTITDYGQLAASGWLCHSSVGSASSGEDPSMLSIIVALLKCNSPLASSIFAPATSLMSAEFDNDSTTLSTFTVSFFILGYVVSRTPLGNTNELSPRTWLRSAPSSPLH